VRRFQILAALFLLHAALSIALYLGRAPLVRFDHSLDDALRHLHHPILRKTAFILLQMGSPYVIAGVGFLFGVFLLARRRWAALATWAVALIGCALLDYVLKEHFKRIRPPTLRWMPGWTFPSGHTMAAIVAYGMLAYLTRCRVRGRKKRVAWLAAPAVLAMVTGVALLVPGHHYFTDVVAGYLDGVLWLLMCIAFTPHGR